MASVCALAGLAAVTAHPRVKRCMLWCLSSGLQEAKEVYERVEDLTPSQHACDGKYHA